MIRRNWLLGTSGLCSVLLLATPALAGPWDARSTLPAVSGPNAKAAAFAGSIAGRSAAGATVSLTVPFGDRFGAQIDGLAGDANGGSFFGVGGHVFWRDPSRGLIGAYGSYVGWNLAGTTPVATPIGGFATITAPNVGKAGVEAEAYLGQMSLEGILAWQFGTNSGIAGQATAAFYPTDNLRLALGYRYTQGLGSVGTGGFEWAFGAGNRLSAFADGGYGRNGYWHAFGGLRVHLGDDKTLIRRHREDDPTGILPADLHETIGEGECPVGKINLSGFCDGVI